MSPSPDRDEGLLRTLGAAGAAAFVVSNMVGAGIFTVPSFVRVATGSSLGSLAVWLAAGVLGLCGALCYAELATRMPDAGGEYRYLARSFGPLWGFLSGWTSFIVGFSAAVAASALGAVAYLAPLLPDWQPATPLVGGVITEGAAVAAMLVLLLTAVHSLGVRSSGRFQATMAVVVLGAIGIMVVGGFASGRGNFDGLMVSSEPHGSWWVALLQVTYAYAGWNAAAYMAGEVRSPGRNLPRAILGGTVFVTIVYLAVNALFFYAVPEPNWEPTIAIGQLAAERLFGSGGALAVSALIGLAMFGSVSAMMAVGPRVYFAMGRDGLAPQRLAALSSGGRVPVVAIVAQGLLASVLALTGAFETLLIYIGSSLLLFNALTVATLFRVRARDGAPPPGSFGTPLYPLPALVFIGTTAAAWINGLIDRPIPTGAALLTLAAGAAFYSWAQHQGRIGA